MNGRPFSRPCRNVLLTAAIAAGTSTCMGVAPSWATHADGTYTCLNGQVATRVVIDGASLTPNFDAAEYRAPGTDPQAVHRLPDGTVPDLVFYFDGALTTVTFTPHYTGPNGADSRTPLIVAHIDGDVPDCTPATTTTTPSPTTTLPPASTSTTAPASSTTTVIQPPTTAPPGPTTTAATSSHTLPATGIPATLVAFIGGVIVAIGGYLLDVARRLR